MRRQDYQNPYKLYLLPEAKIPAGLKYYGDIESRRYAPKRGSCIFTCVPRGWCFNEKYLSVCTLRVQRLQHTFTASFMSQCSMKSAQFFIRFSDPDVPWPLALRECPQLITTPLKHTPTFVTFLSQFVPNLKYRWNFWQTKISYYCNKEKFASITF